ncbi:hypothetical protein IJZ97_01650 [bacterium]|nr:hypothetical protein [bacterium]
MSVLFDPGYAQHTSILSINIEYIYANVSRFKNLGQRKNQFKMYYTKILKLVENNVSFCLGCMLWAKYIKSLGTKNILNNPCLGGIYNEAEAVEEIDYSLQFFDQLKKDVKYYLGLDYNVDPKYIKVLEIYRDFLTLNKGFVDTKTTDDIEFPMSLKTPEDMEKVNSKIQEVVKSGNLVELFELYGTIL